jgi:eukaryotic-like serine/threonine-protein kinase
LSIELDETSAGGSGVSVTLEAGGSLGKYRLQRVLGEGGMGQVWAAHDPDLDRAVAIKVLRFAHDSMDLRKRLLREARAMAKLKHPNVLTVYEVGTVDNRDYIAMELVDGSTLDQWLATSPPDELVWEAILAAGRGLAAAHAAGVVHRDFKPHNVLRSRNGRVLVTDFGLARGLLGEADSAAVTATTTVPLEMAATVSPVPATDGIADTLPAAPVVDGAADTLAAAAAVDGVSVTLTQQPAIRGTAPSKPPSASRNGDSVLDVPLTQTGALIGTPAYMAPEQFFGAPPDPRTDQFAFCVTAWQASTGERPFKGQTIDELREAASRGVAHLETRMPRAIRGALERGLDPRPAARWPTLECIE